MKVYYKGRYIAYWKIVDSRMSEFASKVHTRGEMFLKDFFSKKNTILTRERITSKLTMANCNQTEIMSSCLFDSKLFQANEKIQNISRFKNRRPTYG